MTDEILGFGIIGSGMIASLHARAIGSLNDVRLVAVAGRSGSTTRSLADEHGADWHMDYHELLRRADIAVITISTPSGLHGDMAIAAARAGKHVIVEKPMDISLDSMAPRRSDCGESHGYGDSRIGNRHKRIHTYL